MKLHQRIRREHGRHTDDWLITYADTITLLLCLFVVLLSLKTNGKTSRNVAPPAPVPETIFSGRSPFHALTPITEATEETTMVDAAGELPNTQPHAPPGGGSAAVHFVDAPVFPQAAEANPGPAETARTATAAREIAKPETPNPATETAAIGDLLKSRGDAIVAREGDRITTLQISSAAFFGSGYATLSLPGKSILRDVAVTLKSPEFAAYRISIEGHTDDSPISTSQFQSNWELSTARAAAVVRFFLEQGIPPWKLTAAGYADTFPIAPNRNVDGTVIPDNQAKNRRVVIRLEKIDKARE